MPLEPRFVADESAAEAHSLRPVAVAEILQYPSPRWLVRGLLAALSFVVMFGAPGSGKTFLALDLACAIARHGVRWLGRRVKQGGVIYVAAEGHLRNRLAAYLTYHGLEPDALARLRIVASRVNLLAPESGDLDTLITEIETIVDAIGGVVLVVLDTLNSMMPGGNENTSEDMGAMIAAARRLMEAIGCTVIYVHHSGKEEAKGSRGHSSLKGAVDSELHVTGEIERVLEAIKVRDGEPGQRFGFRLQSVDLGGDPDPDAEPGERLSSCVIVPLDHLPVKAKVGKPMSADQKNARDALQITVSEYGDRLPQTSAIPPGVRAVTMSQWRDRYYLIDRIDADETDAAEVKREQEARKKRFQRARNSLRAAGNVGNVGDLWWLN